LKCPNCGVYLVVPVDMEAEDFPKFCPKAKFSLAIESPMRKIT
jgi:hypothetical protein